LDQASRGSPDNHRLSIVLYTECFRYDSFAPEFPFFYYINHGLTFEGLLREYRSYGHGWYRPTAFFLPYWIGKQFIGWHDLFGWKVLYFTTFLAACYALYAFSLRLFSGNRLAALLAALYFAAHPCEHPGNKLPKDCEEDIQKIEGTYFKDT